MQTTQTAKRIQKVELTYDQILSRDVPKIVDVAKNWARQGICASIEVFYSHEAIAGESTAVTRDLTDEGWKRTGVEIPCNIPYLDCAPASVLINSPRALMQIEAKIRLDTLHEVIGETRPTFKCDDYGKLDH